jgi:hypothetical protein
LGIGENMTEDEIIEMASPAKWIGCDHGWTFNTYKQLDAFAKRIAQHEREACAKVVEASPSYDWHKFACEAAYAIRARGQA